MKRIALATSLAFALLLVSGCASDGDGSVSDGAPSGSNAGDAESASPKQPATPTFGQTYTTKSGISVTISRATPFTPSEYAAVTEKHPAYRSFNVTVVNKSGSKYDPSLFTTTLQSGDEEAEEVFDTDRGFNGAPSTSLLPGRQARFEVGYGVSKPRDLVMDVDINDDDFNSVTFVNN